MVFLANCDPKNIKNHRTRCSALIKSKDENILIDTSPDLRNQMIQNKIKSIDKVLYTHNHADQTHGINDLRVFYLKRRKKYLFMLIILQKSTFQEIFLIVLKSIKIIHQY